MFRILGHDTNCVPNFGLPLAKQVVSGKESILVLFEDNKCMGFGHFLSNKRNCFSWLNSVCYKYIMDRSIKLIAADPNSYQIVWIENNNTITLCTNIIQGLYNSCNENITQVSCCKCYVVALTENNCVITWGKSGVIRERHFGLIRVKQLVTNSYTVMLYMDDRSINILGSHDYTLKSPDFKGANVVYLAAGGDVAAAILDNNEIAIWDKNKTVYHQFSQIPIKITIRDDCCGILMNNGNIFKINVNGVRDIKRSFRNRQIKDFACYEDDFAVIYTDLCPTTPKKSYLSVTKYIPELIKLLVYNMPKDIFGYIVGYLDMDEEYTMWQIHTAFNNPQKFKISQSPLRTVDRWYYRHIMYMNKYRKRSFGYNRDEQGTSRYKIDEPIYIYINKKHQPCEPVVVVVKPKVKREIPWHVNADITYQHNATRKTNRRRYTKPTESTRNKRKKIKRIDKEMKRISSGKTDMTYAVHWSQICNEENDNYSHGYFRCRFGWTNNRRRCTRHTGGSTGMCGGYTYGGGCMCGRLSKYDEYNEYRDDEYNEYSDDGYDYNDYN